MKSLIPLFPFVAALGLLACQGNDGPVARDAAAPPDNVVGDAGTRGIDAPANAASAEAADLAAAPLAGNGLGWTMSTDGRSASFGPVGTGASAMLTFLCDGSGSGRRLVVTRISPAHAGATATLSFTGGGHASSLPMHGIAKSGEPGESEWQGAARGDMARAVARAFEGEGLVNVTLGGTPALAVPTDSQATAFLRRCA